MSDDAASGARESDAPARTDPHRLTMPALELPENPTDADLKRAMANAILSIAMNLQFLREDAESRAAQETANERVIREHERRIAALERVVGIKPAKSTP